MKATTKKWDLIRQAVVAITLLALLFCSEKVMQAQDSEPNAHADSNLVLQDR